MFINTCLLKPNAVYKMIDGELYEVEAEVHARIGNPVGRVVELTRDTEIKDMRLIDANELIKHIINDALSTKDKDDVTRELWELVITVIEAAPTAYDLQKVLELVADHYGSVPYEELKKIYNEVKNGEKCRWKISM